MPAEPAPAPWAALAGLVDLLGRRHALGLIAALRGPAQPFRALVQTSGAAEAALSQRLRELRQAGLVEIDEAGDYRLSAHGRRLQGALEPVADFAAGWRELSPRQRLPRGAATRARGEP